jgi:VRR-NUC domain
VVRVSRAPSASESNVLSQVRLAAPALQCTLLRNNQGVLRDERGRPVRFGLGNESAALVARFASPDLVGWTRYTVTPADVGRTIAVMTGIECKTDTGRVTPQQQAWLDRLAADGGVSGVARGRDDLAQIINGWIIK